MTDEPDPRLPVVLPPARLSAVPDRSAGPGPPDAAGPYARPVQPAAPHESPMTDRTDQPEGADDPHRDRDARPSLEGVADFNVVVADEAARAARDRARLAAEAAEAAQAAAEQAAAESRRHHDSAERSVSSTAAPLHDVAEVSKQVIAAMRAINQAHHAHIESLELEAARRCELATAQAELDAELIRLHARREAHAVVAAARLRAGEIDADGGEPDQLGEIGETFSRFAETIEIAMAPGPDVPDPHRRP